MILHRTLHHESGFTLVEVMVALAIVALALTTLVETHTAMSLSRARYAEITRAAFLAQARFSDWDVAGYPDLGISDGTEQGTFEGEDSLWQWSVMEEPQSMNGLQGVVAVKLTIENTQTGHRQEFIRYRVKKISTDLQEGE